MTGLFLIFVVYIVFGLDGIILEIDCVNQGQYPVRECMYIHRSSETFETFKLQLGTNIENYLWLYYPKIALDRNFNHKCLHIAHISNNF